MEKHLTSDFLFELFKLSFSKKIVLDMMVQHFKYQYIPDELKGLKKILKSILTYYSLNNKPPTFGYVAQQHSSDIEVQELVVKIKNVNSSDVNDITDQLEDYIKKIKFQLLYEKVYELYTKDKQDEAILLNAEESEKIVNFSIRKNTDFFLNVFGDFEEDQKRKELRKINGEDIVDKIPTGIAPIDEVMYGGIDKIDMVLFLGRSGTGKSTVLKYIGVVGARLGYDILHIQLESTKQEAFDKYTQVWTACSFHDVKYANIEEEKMVKLKGIVDKMNSRQRDIKIHSFEKFDEATCLDVRNLVIEYFKIYGKYPDMLIIDSIDLLHPGDGLTYGISTEAIKAKKENSARKLKNINTEFGCRIVTVDQADNIVKEYWNNPKWCMSRNNISGAKNLGNAFSYIFTINTTEDEEKNNLTRVYVDKSRYYLPKDRVLKIATNFDKGRFYDNKRTLILQKDE